MEILNGEIEAKIQGEGLTPGFQAFLAASFIQDYCIIPRVSVNYSKKSWEFNKMINIDKL